jgi:hypothetical protein
MPRRSSPINSPAEQIGQFILVLRRHRVLLDQDLAELYGVETRVLVQAVKRNLSRFPSDFMFQLTAAEWAALRSQTVILKPGRGQHRKYLPYAFTEQGVAMLSSVLNSERAIAVNIEINARVCAHPEIACRRQGSRAQVRTTRAQACQPRPSDHWHTFGHSGTDESTRAKAPWNRVHGRPQGIGVGSQSVT